MPTKPIPQGTCNFAVNMPHELRSDGGRLAAMDDESFGAWIRDLVREKVREAKLSGRLAQAGQLTMRLGAWVCFSVGASITGYEALLGQSNSRRRVNLHEKTRLVHLVRPISTKGGVA